MTGLNIGVQGATRTSWMEMSPREVLKEILKAHHPQEDREKISELFNERIRADETGAYASVFVEYWFSNHYRYLTEEKDKPNGRALVERVKGEIQSRIKQEAEVILLDTILPNGKQLRDCTGKECGEIGNKMGRWLTLISKNIKPQQKVGEVLTEKQVRAFYGK